MEAVRVGHHHDARDGEDGGHDLDGGREGVQGGAGAGRKRPREARGARGRSPRRPCSGEREATAAPVSVSVPAWTGTTGRGWHGRRTPTAGSKEGCLRPAWPSRAWWLAALAPGTRRSGHRASDGNRSGQGLAGSAWPLPRSSPRPSESCHVIMSRALPVPTGRARPHCTRRHWGLGTEHASPGPQTIS